jgi:hypothetical protein
MLGRCGLVDLPGTALERGAISGSP